MHGDLAMPKMDLRKIVVVLGMHRSGTSLCSHVLSALGFDMADDVGVNEGNQKGHWERWELMDFNDRILALFDRSWHSQKHSFAMPPAWWADPRVRAIREEMIAWLRPRMGERRRFGFKDPRVSILLPVWKEIFFELDLQPQFVLCLRSPNPVARSVAARGDVPGLLDPELRWLMYNARATAHLAADPVCVVPYEDWFEDDLPNVRRLGRFLDIKDQTDNPLVHDTVRSIVAPNLRHQLPDPSAKRAEISEALYRLLAGSSGTNGLDPKACDLAVACCRFQQFVEPIQLEALRVGSLLADIAQRDTQLAEFASREEVLQVQLVAARERLALLSAEVDALRSALAARDATLEIGAKPTEPQCVVSLRESPPGDAIIVESDDSTTTSIYPAADELLEPEERSSTRQEAEAQLVNFDQFPAISAPCKVADEVPACAGPVPADTSPSALHSGRPDKASRRYRS